MTKILCSLGWHRFARSGWAIRLCGRCLLREVNIYHNGKATWQEPPEGWRNWA
jgi:hypothetical protein